MPPTPTPKPPATAPKKLLTAEQEAALDAVETAPPVDPLASVGSAPPPTAPVVMPEHLARAPQWRVKRAGRVSFYGQMIYLPEGEVLNESSYGGEPGIKRLRDAGADLERV
jgi:hypothetical protein